MDPIQKRQQCVLCVCAQTGQSTIHGGGADVVRKKRNQFPQRVSLSENPIILRVCYQQQTELSCSAREKKKTEKNKQKQNNSFLKFKHSYRPPNLPSEDDDDTCTMVQDMQSGVYGYGHRTNEWNRVILLDRSIQRAGTYRQILGKFKVDDILRMYL